MRFTSPATKSHDDDLRKEIFTLKQLHHVYANPPSSAYRFIAEGRLHTFKIGGRRLVRRDDVEAFLASQTGE
jgi:hypothetical protein